MQSCHVNVREIVSREYKSCLDPEHVLSLVVKSACGFSRRMMRRTGEGVSFRHLTASANVASRNDISFTWQKRKK